MGTHGPNRDSRNTNALAVVAGALIALIAVLAFLAVISHRGGAQEQPGAAGRGAEAAAIAAPRPQLTVSVDATPLPMRPQVRQAGMNAALHSFALSSCW